MTLKVRIEAPTTPLISSLATPIKGWISADEYPKAVSIRYGGSEVPLRIIERPDVERAFPGNFGIGFNAKLDFRLEYVDTGKASVDLMIDGERHPIASLDHSAISAGIDNWKQTKKQKMEVIARIAACPVCRSDLEITDSQSAIFCRSCSSVYYRNSTNFDFLPQYLRDEFRLVETENVSAHPYPNEGKKFFKEIIDRGGLVLDMGAGDQAHIHPSIICTEVVAYPATDVLSVGQRLPFRDQSFDGVYTNAVLEHVTDPFACAEELMRVLKPGGKVFCSVPFLQPEHGYPHHYYNMTQDGLTNLFTRLGATPLEKATPNWGHPLYAGQWFLSSYLHYLPVENRKKMESLSIAEFLKLRRSAKEPIFSSLSAEGMRVLACATYATFLKS
ncbi:class I SAM-dependent methyltransferase [Mesorhizobium sp. RMAD-H1]|uniref:methyltransferase domain-containing protein n=1 Tax=Mesorhizobium sp. RMAD-H1 TaxID=2587065 RepID=UPI0017B2DE13|nr:class I SAM-dependent methyltransferase [Mesorhizobium sp. RMAD-H1]MBB2971424.1 SAM-dependent methyltransferase [Mesorhizobium sp. RMAD-H1]